MQRVSQVRSLGRFMIQCVGDIGDCLHSFSGVDPSWDSSRLSGPILRRYYAMR